jgi:hypothetical protein
MAARSLSTQRRRRVSPLDPLRALVSGGFVATKRRRNRSTDGSQGEVFGSAIRARMIVLQRIGIPSAGIHRHRDTELGIDFESAGASAG